MAEGGMPLNKIEVLTGQNYEVWALKVSSVLRSRKLFKNVILDPEPPVGERDSNEEKIRQIWECKNDEAFGIIILSLSDEQAGLFINETNARKVWFELKRIHTGNIEDRKIDIGLELKSIQMNELESVDEYITRARNVASRSAVLGQPISTREVVYHIVRGIHPKLEKIATVLRTQRNASLEEIQQTLREEEARLNLVHKMSSLRIHNENRLEKAYKVRTTRKDGRNDFNTGQRCFICGKKGHIAKECWHRKDKITTPHNQKFKTNFNRQGRRVEMAKGGHSTYKPNQRQNENALSATPKVVEANNVECTDEIMSWSLDSGCTAHMSPYNEWMMNIRPYQAEVKVAEQGRIIEALAIGDIKVSTRGENNEVKELCIKDVLYVPSLRGNLLSVKSLTEKGNKVIFKREGAEIINKNNEVLARPSLQNQLYILKTFPRNDYAATANQEGSGNELNQKQKNGVNKDLWHKRFGHVNENYLDQLKQNDMVKGLEYENAKLTPCESCIMGKLVQLPFDEINYDYIMEPLELIHIDLCGPMPQESLGGARYLLLIVDTFSRHIFIKFLALKSDAYEAFVEFMNRVENEQNRNIKAVRSDNGNEFINQRFEDLFKERGIQHEKTVPYTPQSNGIAERANRTILDKTRTMLLDSSLPLSFWAEAAATAVYLKNRTPTKNGGNRTPSEKWNGHKPAVSFFKVFGCMAYYFVPKNQRNKLESKAEKGIFVGYSQSRKAYRIFNVNDKSVHEVRSVKFNESLKGAELLENKNIETVNLDITNFLYDNITRKSLDGEQDEKQRTEIIHSEESIDKGEENIVRRLGRKPGETNEILQESHRRNLQERVRRSERMKAFQQADCAESSEMVPSTYKEAIESKHAEKWKDAMGKELNSMSEHNVWELVPRHQAKKVIKSKWVFALKENSENSDKVFKARLVAMGHSQRPGMDYHETYAPVMQIDSLRTLIAIATNLKLEMKMYDIKTAYLYGDLDEDIYMEQPEGFKVAGQEDEVCKLRKSIYGLPQSGHNWNEKLNAILVRLGLERLKCDPCLYLSRDDTKFYILGVYVDDIIIIGSEMEGIHSIVSRIRENVEIYENNSKKFLGIEIEENENGYVLSQEAYIGKILHRFEMDNCNPVNTPGDPQSRLENFEESKKIDKLKYQEMIGSLMYVSRCTRPDITYAVNSLSQYNEDPRQIHLTAVKRIYRYLKGTKTYKLKYEKSEMSIEVSTDASWCSTKDAKSFSGSMMKIGKNLISWKSQKQPIVSLSTCEAELIALSDGMKETLWLLNLLEEMNLIEYLQKPVIINTDSKAAHDWCKRESTTGRTKHINRRYYFVKDEIKKETVELNLVKTENMQADFLTKMLSNEKLNKIVIALGLNTRNVNSRPPTT